MKKSQLYAISYAYTNRDRKLNQKLLKERGLETVFKSSKYTNLKFFFRHFNLPYYNYGILTRKGL